MREVTTILVQVQAFSRRASNAFDNADAIGHAAELCFWAAKATAAGLFSIIYSSPEAHTSLDQASGIQRLFQDVFVGTIKRFRSGSNRRHWLTFARSSPLRMVKLTAG